MIKKLKRKFIFILMSVAFIFLSAILSFAFLTTKQNMEKNSRDLLMNTMFANDAFQGTGEMPAGQPDDGNDPDPDEMIPHEMRMPFLVLQYLPDDTYEIFINQSFYANEDEIKEIVETIIAAEADFNTLPNSPVRYLRMDTPDGIRISIVDITMENIFLAGMFRNSLIIGAIALGAFFLFSVLLANWATKPVQQSWEAQKRFVADASHELKTPLTVILSNADMLSKNELLKTDPKLNNRILNINSEARRMKLLVEDLLELARFDSIDRRTELTKLDLSFIVMSTILKFEAVIYDQNKTLDYNVEEDVFILGSEEQIKKMASIFIDNAIKYSNKGCRIAIRLNKNNNNQAVLSVHNEGSLITKEELNKIFGRFYRINEVRQNHGGFGLGLSIAQNIAKDHKCKITVESSKTNGTTFHATFPLL